MAYFLEMVMVSGIFTIIRFWKTFMLMYDLTASDKMHKLLWWIQSKMLRYSTFLSTITIDARLISRMKIFSFNMAIVYITYNGITDHKPTTISRCVLFSPGLGIIVVTFDWNKGYVSINSISGIILDFICILIRKNHQKCIA